MSNPFADPESFLDYGVRVKDVKDTPVPRRTTRKASAPASGTPLTTPSSAGTGFSLETVAHGYRLHNVLHRGETYDFDWSDALLPGDGTATPKYHTQDVWLSQKEYRTIDKVVFDIPSAPEYASTILALYRHRDTKDTTQQKLLAEFKNILADDFQKYWMMTSTRTTYTPKGKDTIEHNRSRKDHYSIDEAVAGSNTQLTPSMTTEANAWLGVTDVPEFLAAATWLTGKNVSYLWRCEKEKKAFERALVLGVDDDGRFSIGANGNVYVSRPARGVAVRKKTSTGTGGSP